MLDRVTITGADDSVALGELSVLPYTDYPFVEWGILFSATKQGSYRFPSAEWLRSLKSAKELNPKMKLSAHLCGRYVRDLVQEGRESWFEQHSGLWHIFDRIQLNFHGNWHKISGKFLEVLPRFKGKQVIFQVDGVNDDAWAYCQRYCDAVPFFDASHGAGVMPQDWPKPYNRVYNGYSGGLGHENLVLQIPKILDAAGKERIWIDMETKVRSGDGSKFDLDKVRACLMAAAPFVTTPI